jgi:hypothetical protein
MAAVETRSASDAPIRAPLVVATSINTPSLMFE